MCNASGITTDDARRKGGVEQCQIVHGMGHSQAMEAIYAPRKNDNSEERTCYVGYHPTILNDDGQENIGGQNALFCYTCGFSAATNLHAASGMQVWALGFLMSLGVVATKCHEQCG